MITLCGLAAGVGVTATQMRLTDFPIDMIIYREGVQAFFSGREVYGEPMMAGDIALPFIYPPFGAVALAPLAPAAISHAIAGDVMIAISGGLMLACLYVVLRAVIRERDRPWLLPLTAAAWPAAMSIEPVVLNDDFAQINVVIMALVVFDLVPRKRVLPQGWLIGLAIAIKISPAAMLLYFLIQRRLAPILVAAGSALAATGLAAAIRWDQTKEFFLSVLVDMGSDSNFGVDSTYTSNSSLKGMVMRFSPTRDWLENNGLTVNIIWAVLALATILVGAWVMVRLIARGAPTQAWLVNALIMLLISPISWSHHWVWLALLFAVVGYRTFVWGAEKTQEKTAQPMWRHIPGTSWICAFWVALVITLPPKWWFGDGVEFEDLNFFATFLVSDFVWLALAFMAAVALRTRPSKTAIHIA
ncbi:membrane protein [Corynebacterium atypicum]|uniref:Membrane protein n=1 Tax=Corynebacterium atypicum TaxID=191610 RepID=A0ABM5QNG4_9CORY|nr:membrane protein [Corynebacterium atypicum]